MSNKPVHVVRRNGVYYTPSSLADVLVKLLVKKQGISILDPACGEGALLRAATERHASLFKGGKAKLYGCDKLRHEGFPDGLPNSHFTQTDFLKYKTDQLFDAVVMNPPFLASSRITGKNRSAYHAQYRHCCRLALNADIWTYFLLKSISHLKPGGSVAAILPWAFLQAEYAANVRKWLAERFGAIRVLVLTNGHFEDTTKRVLLLWLENHGKATASISVAYAPEPLSDCRYESLSTDAWNSKSLSPRMKGPQKIINECMSKYKFIRFGDIAIVRIGVVTGADNFFIVTPEIAKSRGFRASSLVPIFRSSKTLSGLRLKGESAPHQLLLNLPHRLSAKYQRYLMKGRRDKIHLLSHSVRREPWYRVDIGRVPDAFFHYRVSSVPFLSLNIARFQCTNSTHRIYFRNTNDVMTHRWAQISLLSIFGQLSIEASSRVYGNGILKIEPSSLKLGLVLIPKVPLPKDLYRRINTLLILDRKSEAVELATRALKRAARLPNELIERAEAALKEVRGYRLS